MDEENQLNPSSHAQVREESLQIHGDSNDTRVEEHGDNDCDATDPKSYRVTQGKIPNKFLLISRFSNSFFVFFVKLW